MEQNMDHDYHPLPGSDSPADAKGEASFHNHNIADDDHVSYQSKPNLNKYALAGAILASTNSILLGYGEWV